MSSHLEAEIQSFGQCGLRLWRCRAQHRHRQTDYTTSRKLKKIRIQEHKRTLFGQKWAHVVTIEATRVPETTTACYAKVKLWTFAENWEGAPGRIIAGSSDSMRFVAMITYAQAVHLEKTDMAPLLPSQCPTLTSPRSSKPSN